MLKKSIFAGLAILLIAGFVVGTFFVQESNGTKSESKYRSGGGGMLSNSLDVEPGQASPDADEKFGSQPAVDPQIDCIEQDCSAYSGPGKPDPVVGNPKGNKIVKTGTVEITISRGTLDKKFQNLVSSIPDGGYVEASESSKKTSTVTLRIPTEKLDSTLAKLRKLGSVKSESVSSLDRTFESIDNEARLKVMREREAVLNELMKKATTSFDARDLQNQIFDLRIQIESLQGQQDMLNDQVSLSTLTVTLTEKGFEKEDKNDRPILVKSWETSAGVFLNTISGILIVLTAIFPILVIVLGVYFLFKKKAFRK